MLSLRKIRHSFYYRRSFTTSQNQAPSTEIPSKPVTNPKAKHNIYCRDKVQALDYPHYFSSLFSTPVQRQALLALRSFNIELASIKSVAKNRESGDQRIRWWKMVLAETYKGTISSNPTGIAIAEAICNHTLTNAWFTRLLNARQKDLFSAQPSTLAELESYCEDTSGSLLYLALEVLGVRNPDADHAASHLGQALGLITIIKALPFVASPGDIYLPQDLTAKAGVSQEHILRKTADPEKLRDVVYEVANRAHHHLGWAREFNSKVPKEAIPAFLPSAFAEDYLIRLEKENFDPFVKQLSSPPGFKPRIKATYNYYRSTF